MSQNCIDLINPFRNLFYLENLTHYNILTPSTQNACCSAVRKIFPKIQTLDGTLCPPEITFDLEDVEALPPSKDCYFCNDSAQELLVTFVKEYFRVFDSGQRRDLAPAYHENAQFSMAVCRNPAYGFDKGSPQLGFSRYLEDSRNLKKIGHFDSEKLFRKTKVGQLSIVSCFETAFPKTTHDIPTFKMDLPLVVPTSGMMTFTLHGVFKEPSQKSSKGDDPVRSFSRTFVVVSQGGGVVILNDMLMISNADKGLVKKSFQTPTAAVAVPASAGAAGAAGLTAQQTELLAQFCRDSGMTPEFSQQCLQENGWDYQKAGTIFTQLKAEGKIPPEAFVNADSKT